MEILNTKKIVITRILFIQILLNLPKTIMIEGQESPFIAEKNMATVI